MIRRVAAACCVALCLFVGMAGGAAADGGGSGDCDVYCSMNNGIGGIASGLSDGFASMASGFSSGLSSLGSGISSAFQAIIQPLWDTGSDALTALFVPPGGFGQIAQPIKALVESTPLKYLSSVVAWMANLPTVLFGGGAACPAISLGQAPSFSAASACSVLGLAAGAGDWSLVRQLVRVGFWAFFVIALYRSITRLMAGA